MRHASVTVFVHLVWATWDRLPFLTGDVERRVYRAIGDKCVALGAQIIALGGVEDHVHLLVRLPAAVSIADLVKHLKGASAHLITHETPNAPFFKWQGAYAAFSVSPRHLHEATDYITHQRQHHQAGTLIPALEPSDDRDDHEDRDRP